MERPVIYVKRITNLSDARYCAGMGADLLGFVASPGHEDYVSPVAFKEIMGWVSGPRRVVELTDLPAGGFDEVISNYSPDLIHISFNVSSSLIIPDFPFIIEAVDVVGSVSNLKKLGGTKIEFIVAASSRTDSEILKIKALNSNLLIAMGKNEALLAGMLTRTGAAGIVLQGSPELRPGLKDYDHLSTVLEALDF